MSLLFLFIGDINERKDKNSTFGHGGAGINGNTYYLFIKSKSGCNQRQRPLRKYNHTLSPADNDTDFNPVKIKIFKHNKQSICTS